MNAGLAVTGRREEVIPKLAKGFGRGEGIREFAVACEAELDGPGTVEETSAKRRLYHSSITKVASPLKTK
jgi:hypothetical protein